MAAKERRLVGAPDGAAHQCEAMGRVLDASDGEPPGFHFLDRPLVLATATGYDR
jgi:hypothetical protein